MAEDRPFLRWVGGKARIAQVLASYVPDLPDGACYFEPFLGAGSVFFRIKPKRCVLGDLNVDLIDCFRRVRDRPDLVWRYLRPLIQQQEQHEYYMHRREYNSLEESYRRAALFIYLNKTCFNGIWRVSREGQFNVPWGAKEKAGFPTPAELRRASVLLSGASLLHGDFEAVVTSAQSGDIVYFDPPYLPLSATAFFRHYTRQRFSLEDHERVAIVARDLAERGVEVLITEGDCHEVRKWYRDFEIIELSVRRYVSSGPHREEARELVIRSFRG
jgi:DNA adenine methylase